MTIYEQLAAYCECEKVVESDVDHLIDLISMATCWTQRPCENFLMAERKEVIDLPDCLDECNIVSFMPFFTPFEESSFEFTLVKREGIEETYTSIHTYAWSEADETFRLQLPIPTCECQPCTCGCKPEYKLMVTYDAGYEELPECLLPVFCEALKYVHELRTCDCEVCSPCSSEVIDTQDYASSYSIRDRLKDFFVVTLTRQYVRQLSLIALCDRSKEIWAVVV